MKEPIDKILTLHALTMMERAAAEIRKKIAAEKIVLSEEYNCVEKGIIQTSLSFVGMTEGLKEMADSFSQEKTNQILAELEKWKNKKGEHNDS